MSIGGRKQHSGGKSRNKPHGVTPTGGTGFMLSVAPFDLGDEELGKCNLASGCGSFKRAPS